MKMKNKILVTCYIAISFVFWGAAAGATQPPKKQNRRM